MPVYRTGDMWSVFDDVDHFIVTTNSFVKQNGALVMGAGIARQVRDRYPGVDLKMGSNVRKIGGHLGEYYLILGRKLGLFQVKYHFKDSADLDLIKMATYQLTAVAQANPQMSFALNFPGIGNGGLSTETVKPIIDGLPDNVSVWTFK